MDYSLNRDHLDDAITRQARHLSQLEDRLKAIDKVVDRLHTTWTGDAAKAHGEAHDRWKHGFTEMVAGLREMKSAAETAQHNYKASLASNVKMWSGL